jgi:hypothetical protein
MCMLTDSPADLKQWRLIDSLVKYNDTGSSPFTGGVGTRYKNLCTEVP